MVLKSSVVPSAGLFIFEKILFNGQDILILTVKYTSLIEKRKKTIRLLIKVTYVNKS